MKNFASENNLASECENYSKEGLIWENTVPEAYFLKKNLLANQMKIWKSLDIWSLRAT